VKTIAIINHAVPKNKIWNIVEGVLTGEILEQDRKGKEEALRGLVNKMGQSNRFVVINTGEIYEGSGSMSGKTFPIPLEWRTVEQICAKYNADVVLSLENFDSDYIITGAQKDVTNNGTKTVEYSAKGVASIYIGFRMYDPRIKSIIDEQNFDSRKSWTATGTNAGDAVAHLIAKAQAVYAAAFDAGEDYAYRVTPLYITVNRMYYKKGKQSPDIETGFRHAAVNDWNDAINSWQNALNSPNRKDPGRAAYNIAIGYEVQGNLELALEWAKKAYSKYGNNQAQQYVYTLEKRIDDQKLLNNQTGK
jgi:tetratricopeptide (TPR) repeat protein